MLSDTRTYSYVATLKIEKLEAKLKLLKVSRSVKQICSLMPCLLEEAGRRKFTQFIENYKTVPKDITILKIFTFGQFSLPEE